MTSQNIAQLFDLTDKAAIVTGAAMGIGQGIALRLAEAGASVMITDINMEAARQTAEQISARGGKAQAMHSDAGNATEAKNVVQTTVEAFGRLDILVNNAGIYPFAKALQINEELWDKVFNINIKGVYFHIQAAALEMIKAGRGGRIVNIASIDALHPAGGMAHYDASKGAVVMLTKAMALELGRHGILVNAVAPGSIMTPGARAQSIDERMKQFVPRLPLRRLGEPDDVAKVVLFLASAAADYMTGTLLVVDGGHLLT